MRGRATYRGQPLVALMLVIGGWVAVRAVLLDASQIPLQLPLRLPLPIPVPLQLTLPVLSAGSSVTVPEAESSVSRRAGKTHAVQANAYRRRPTAQAWPESVHGDDGTGLQLPSATARAALLPMPEAAEPDASVMLVEPQGLASASHQMLWLMATARLPLPASVLSARDPLLGAVLTKPAPQEAPGRARRWSTDGWLLLRSGTGTAAAGGVQPVSYGASQAGAVVRFKLAPTSQHRPAGYFRGTTALRGAAEGQLALGLSARPVARLPVTLAVEVRAVDQGRKPRLAPAVFAYSELPPVELVHGLRAEAYGQAGYVGGRNRTAFADGQLRVDREVGRMGKTGVRAGGGVWAGAQQGAARLDVGPALSLGIPFAKTGAARMSVDWRVRVAGNAEPRTSGALTLSAGF